jgi:hypothetical protein
MKEEDLLKELEEIENKEEKKEDKEPELKVLELEILHLEITKRNKVLHKVICHSYNIDTQKDA